MTASAPVVSAAKPREGRRQAWFAGGLVVLTAVAAYANSFHGAFLLDDQGSIIDNRTLRHLGEWGRILATPGKGATAQGRPVLNFTLALNYAAGGTSPPGYHAANLLIHILAGLALFGIVRRTLLQPRLRARCGADACWIAWAVAALWTVHPLQTESVTYVIQRAESLMGLFYLLTLYCFIRGVGVVGAGPAYAEGSAGEKAARRRSWGWFGLSWLAWLFGMGTKEVMVTAPVMILLYDRTFVAGTFAGAWRRRRAVYLALGATWLCLAALVISTGGNRGGSFGFGAQIPWWAYGMTQFEAIGRYVRLSLWPSPLIFEYGSFWVRNPLSALPWALPVIGLATAAVVALRRAPAVGFAGCWFFAILAPTSLAQGTTQMIVEHRMYLSLAAVLALLVIGSYGWLGRRSLWFWPAAVVALAALTVRRNEDYRSAEALWKDTVRKRPGNAVAHYNLGQVLAEKPARQAEAIGEFRTALRLNPAFWEAEGSLGNALMSGTGNLPKAIEAFRAAIRLNPNDADGYNNLGDALSSLPGRLPEALDAYRAALRLDPGSSQAHDNLGIVLSGLPGRMPEAEAEFRAALQIDPDFAQAHNNLGMVLAASPQRQVAAMAEYRAALRIDPGYAEAHNNLGNALAGQNRPAEAIAEFEAALRANPGYAQVHYNLGMVLLGVPGRSAEAIAHFRESLRLQPDFEPAREILIQLQTRPSGPLR